MKSRIAEVTRSRIQELGFTSRFMATNGFPSDTLARIYEFNGERTTLRKLYELAALLQIEFTDFYVAVDASPAHIPNLTERLVSIRAHLNNALSLARKQEEQR